MPHLPSHKKRITTIGVGLLIVLALGTAVWLLLWCKCNRTKRVRQKELELLGGMGPRGFDLHELAAATSNFADENKLGRGGFGSVYKGYLKDLDLDVAIKSDVYSFGIVLLEIACGKRPASRQPNGASSLLAWVHNLYSQGMTLDAADQRLNGEFDRQQMERVIVTGLWTRSSGHPLWKLWMFCDL
nr:unnamed protein product [Digitaria exilis]